MLRRAASPRPTILRRARRARPRPRTSGGSPARPTPGCSGPSSSTTTSSSDWLDGDPAQPPPPDERKHGRNAGWRHLYNRDVISMPDKWEYPWYAAWDLAFHMLAVRRASIPTSPRSSSCCCCASGTCTPTGSSRPTSSRSATSTRRCTPGPLARLQDGGAARRSATALFLARVFQKLLINFTWWVNRKDDEGNNLFAGGFLGLDNIGVFDRSQPLPDGRPRSSRPTAPPGWRSTASPCSPWRWSWRTRIPPTRTSPRSSSSTSWRSADAMNSLGGTGLWDEDGRLLLRPDARSTAGASRCASARWWASSRCSRCRAPGRGRRSSSACPASPSGCAGSCDNRQDLARHISFMESPRRPGDTVFLLAIPSRERLVRVLRYVLDESEFLSPYGVRSLSRLHARAPLRAAGGRPGVHRVEYVPGESTTGMFGGNSNWRGPVWFPINYLLIEALERYHHFYGDTLKVECPTGSGRDDDPRARSPASCAGGSPRLFLPDAGGRRPCHGGEPRFADDPHWKDLAPLLRVLPRRRRPRPRRQPPDGLDGAGVADPRRSGGAEAGLRRRLGSAPSAHLKRQGAASGSSTLRRTIMRKLLLALLASDTAILAAVQAPKVEAAKDCVHLRYQLPHRPRRHRVRSHVRLLQRRSRSHRLRDVLLQSLWRVRLPVTEPLGQAAARNRGL